MVENRPFCSKAALQQRDNGDQGREASNDHCGNGESLSGPFVGAAFFQGDRSNQQGEHHGDHDDDVARAQDAVCDSAQRQREGRKGPWVELLCGRFLIGNLGGGRAAALVLGGITTTSNDAVGSAEMTSAPSEMMTGSRSFPSGLGAFFCPVAKWCVARVGRSFVPEFRSAARRSVRPPGSKCQPGRYFRFWKPPSCTVCRALPQLADAMVTSKMKPVQVGAVGRMRGGR